jgi:hypothetical protein
MIQQLHGDCNYVNDNSIFARLQIAATLAVECSALLSSRSNTGMLRWIAPESTASAIFTMASNAATLQQRGSADIAVVFLHCERLLFILIRLDVNGLKKVCFSAITSAKKPVS